MWIARRARMQAYPEDRRRGGKSDDNREVASPTRVVNTENAMFRDRLEAGRKLGALLVADVPLDPVVLGLPRGGVVVAAEVAQALSCPLDIIVVRKLGAPGRPELGVGAIGEHGVRSLNNDLIRYLRISDDSLAKVEQREFAELDRRVARYRRGRPEVSLEGKTAIIVDDGLATGYTALAAVEVARARNASSITLGVPVGAADTVAMLGTAADRVGAVETPADLEAVGFW